MAGDPRVPSSSHDLEQAKRIHAFCEDFESRWRAGAAPRIEEYLDHAGEIDRNVLLEELLFLDVELRRDLGEAPSPEDYLARFPEAAGKIASVFAHEDTLDASHRPSSKPRDQRTLSPNDVLTAFLPPVPRIRAGR